MGNDNPKPKPKEMDVDDVVFELRMQSKQIANASKRSEKESTKEVEKAKSALKKGNEEGAKYIELSFCIL